MFVHSKLGRTALYGMTKDNTVEDIRMAASEALGEPVLGISNDGRILDGTLTVADIMVGDTMAEILIAVVGEVRHKENKGNLSREDEAGQQNRFVSPLSASIWIKGSSPCFCRVLGQARCSWRS